jgi:quinol-cytochrome oxidoreductase complex cytochrome b subunit
VELVVVEAVVLVVVAAVAAVAPFSPSVSLLAPDAAPGVSLLSPGASPGIPATFAHAYPPWYLPSVASSLSELQLVGQLRLVEAVVEDPSLLVVAGVV